MLSCRRDRPLPATGPATEKPITPKTGTARRGVKTAAATIPTPTATRETRAPRWNIDCQRLCMPRSRPPMGRIPIIFERFFEDVEDKWRV